MREVAVGDKFGRWTVLERVASDRNGNARYTCECECGIVRPVLAFRLRSGEAVSCGCYAAEQRLKANTKHGKSTRTFTDPVYTAWTHMNQRCGNPNDAKYEHYGGRGIRVFEPWQSSFTEFFAYVGERPGPEYSLDRIDNDGNYEPGNVRWATRSQQQQNSRRYSRSARPRRRINLIAGSSHTRAP